MGTEGLFFPEEIKRAEPLEPQDEDLKKIQKRCLSSNLQSPLLNFLGKAFFKRAYYRRAAFVFQKLLSVDPKRWRALEALCRCHLALEERSDAIECLASLIERDDVSEETVEWANEKLRNITEQIAQAVSQAEKIRAGEAQAERESSLELSKVDNALIDALEKREILTYFTPNEDQLEKVCRKLRERPKDPRLLEWYAFLLYSNRRIPEAIEIYEGLLAKEEANANILYYLGCAYLKTFKLRSAKASWNALKERYPESSFKSKIDDKLQRLEGIAESKEKRGRSIERTLRKIKRALEQKKKSSCSDGESKSSDAIRELESLLQSEGSNAEYLDWAAYLHYCEGNLSKAREYYQKILEKGEETVNALYYLGEIFYRTGQDKTAKVYWKRLGELYRDHPLCSKARACLEE